MSYAALGFYTVCAVAAMVVPACRGGGHYDRLDRLAGLRDSAWARPQPSVVADMLH
jgi:hypothetical protein